MSKKIITAFGATGNQGGSVIKAIQGDSKLTSEFHIRGVTRDTSKPAAQALAEKGVEVVSADLNSIDSVKSVIKGSHTVFLVTNFWETAVAAHEIAQGRNVAEASKEVGVSHLIFSSLLNATELTQGELAHVSHFDSKAAIAQYIRDLGLGCTFVQPGYFMSNLPPQFRKGEDGVYTLSLPVKESSKFPLIDIAADYGHFVAPALREPNKYQDKAVLAAQDYYTIDRMLAEFSEVTGQLVKYNKITNDQYKSFLPSAAAQELLENHLLIEEPGYYGGAGLKESLDTVTEKLVTWKEFLAKSGPFN